MGQIHPEVAKNYTVDAELYCAQLSFDALLELRGGTPVVKPVPRCPAGTREIAVIFPLARNLIDNKVKIREY